MKVLVAKSHYLDHYLRLFDSGVVSVECDYDADEDNMRFFHQRRGASVYWIQNPPYRRLSATTVGNVCLLASCASSVERLAPSRIFITATTTQLAFGGFIQGASPSTDTLYEELLSAVEQKLGYRTSLEMKLRNSRYKVTITTEQRCSVVLLRVTDNVAFFQHNEEGYDVTSSFEIPATTTAFNFTSELRDENRC